MLSRPSQCDREFIVVGIERAIAQVSDYVLRLRLIRTFVVNFLVEHD